jgi:hypothetical protein
LVVIHFDFDSYLLQALDQIPLPPIPGKEVSALQAGL